MTFQHIGSVSHAWSPLLFLVNFEKKGGEIYRREGGKRKLDKSDSLGFLRNKVQ